MEMLKEEAEKFFDDFYLGRHHWPDKLKECGYGWSMRHYSGVATYDFNQLTRLVVMAHDRCIRVEIQPKHFNYLTITLHKRKRDSENMFERHPTMEGAIHWIRVQEATKHEETTP